jgi:hypothetical protein
MDPKNRKISDYFAELYVAGRLADAGWNIYFPHRDQGFDFIIAKKVGERMVIRPVQVKGKYPFKDKTDKPRYGYVGKLSQIHPDMVLAIPYFSSKRIESIPVCVAYLPRPRVKKNSRGYSCEPASFKSGVPLPRREFGIFFDTTGIQRLELGAWSDGKSLGKGSEHADIGTNDRRNS